MHRPTARQFRTKRTTRVGTRLEVLEPRLVLDSTVVFNEIMYHPPDNGPGTEWIELHNQMGVNMDISDWRLDGGVEFTFPTGTVVPARGFLIVAANPDALSGQTGTTVVLGPFQGELSNSGELIELINNSDRIMDSIEYADAYPWPVAPDGSGASLAKRDLNSATDVATNWTQSREVGGTPGDANFLTPDDLLPVTTTLIDANASWRYDDSGANLGTTWRTTTYDDSQFDVGNATFATPSDGLPQQQALVGLWTFDGDVMDHSGRGNNGSLVGATFSTDVSPAIGAGQSLSFDNPSEHVLIPANASLNSGVFTLSLYIKDRGQAANINRLTSRQGDSFETGIDKHFGSNGLAFHSPASGWNTTPAVPQPQTWHHVAFVSSGNTMTVYLDGAAVASRPFAAAPSGFMHIGNRHNNTEGFNGWIDDVALWNTALSAEDIQTIAGVPTGTELDTAPTTYYFRHEFEFSDDPNRTSLALIPTVDDGAVFYLNGMEVHRQNMPTGAITNSTRALSEVETASGGAVSLPSNLLVNGTNLLAVEVHQANGSSDARFAARLNATVTPAPPEESDRVVFHELPAADGSPFWVELRNEGNVPVNLGGFAIGSTSGSADTYTFPATNLAPNDVIVVHEAQLGFVPAMGDRLFLYGPGGETVLDGVHVTNRPQARSEEYGDRMLVPSSLTPGDDNVFDLNTDIVINEIMYHPRGIAAIPDTPPTYESTVLLPINANGWRYNQTGANLGANWFTSSHSVNNSTWFGGRAPIGFEASPLPEPLNTTLNNPTTNNPRVITYYFETNFQFDGNLNDIDRLDIRHMIDDGAIFYLNGQEVLRYNLPDGNVTSSTLADAVGNAAIVGPASIPVDALVVGTNRLSVEVHQQGADSTDIVMGVELTARRELTPFIPGVPYHDSDEQWIELYNRSATRTVDLSGWSFRDGVDFQFPAGSALGPGEYLVVARNAASMAADYPDIHIAGQFGGQLSRGGEPIELVDALGNPVDSVHYFDSGKWHEAADGGGSSLELRDPDADNTKAEAWAPSDEASRNAWQTITYRGVAAPSSVGPDSQWREFVLGLMTAGEVLLDDISVVEDPDGTAVELIQNGGFESDTVDGLPATWRLLGTHGSHGRSVVTVDPDDPSNQVLRLVATGPQEHMFDHAETTLAGGRAVVNGRVYEISYRVKLLSGANLVNTRLYFNRLARTSVVDAPRLGGTPGAQNTRQATNIGPTYSGLRHSPIVPAPGQDVVVTIAATDPDTVSDLTLTYIVDGGNANSVPMALEADGFYRAIIPGQSARSVVQMYVTGEDGLGATSMYPSAGPQSRALFQIADGRNQPGQKHNFRIIMTEADSDFLLVETNAMSNDRIGATVVYDEATVFYDVGIRLKGSERGRNIDVRRSFNLEFQPDELFRGVHPTVAVDRSGAGNEYSQKEILVKHFINRAGNIPGSYDDLIHVITPRDTHTGSAMLMMARYNDLYLDSQYDDGSDGQLYEYELVYYMTSTVDGNPQSIKLPYNAVGSRDSVVGVNIRDMGDDKEAYRHVLLKKNNRAEDDYSSLIEFAKSFSLTGATFLTRVEETIDVDQWLRAFAAMTLAGIGDSYATGAQHNLQLYVRPEDDRVLLFPHDMDFAFSAGSTSNIVQNSDLSKILGSPENLHNYLGHVHDIVTTSFNASYMGPWVAHYDALVNESFSQFASYIGARATSALSQINSRVAPVSFAITMGDLAVTEPTVTLGGNGWVNVREIRLQGASAPLDVTWVTASQWQATVPVEFGENVLVLEAYDLRGQLIGSDTITVNSSANNPAGTLRVTEINYNPYAPTQDELAVMPGLDNNDFEFLELQNVGTVPVDLTGIRFVEGISFTLPAVSLAAGQRLLVAKEPAAFALRYGSSIAALGPYGGSLNNAGEQLLLADGAGNVLVDIDYSDAAPWPESADGAGATLVLGDPANTPPEESSKHYRWRGSVELGGAPGQANAAPLGVVINEVLTRTDGAGGQLDAIEILNTTNQAIDIGGWYLSDSEDNLLKFPIPAGTMLGAGDYVVFDESDFNPTPNQPAPNHFALNGTEGDDVWLVVANGMRVSSFVDAVHFGATRSGQSLGRAPDGAGRLAPTSRTSLGCENQLASVGPIILSEVNYNPGEPSAAALAIDPNIVEDDLEFIEVHNPTTGVLDLTNWRLAGGIDFEFNDGTTVGAGQSVVIVSFNPASTANQTRVAAFRTHYGISSAVPIVGGWDGQLSDSGEEVRLERPDTPAADEPLIVPYVTDDAVLYDDSAPWPVAADGQGQSMARLSPILFAGDASHWYSATPTPGSVTFASPVVGDFTGDGQVRADDFDRLYDVVRRSMQVTRYDLDGSGVIDDADVSYLVEVVLGTNLGDINLDGSIDGMDLNVWNAHRFQACAGWASGDLNGDGHVDGSDFNIWNRHKFQAGQASPAAPTREVPRAALPQVSLNVVPPTDATRSRETDIGDRLRRASIIDVTMSTEPVPFVPANMRSLTTRRRAESSRQTGTNWEPPERTAAIACVDEVFARDDVSGKRLSF